MNTDNNIEKFVDNFLNFVINKQEKMIKKKNKQSEDLIYNKKSSNDDNKLQNI